MKKRNLLVLMVALFSSYFSEVQALEPKSNIEQLRKSCDAENLKSCGELGSLESHAGNKIEAKKIWQKACDGKEMRGCNGLGTLKEEEGDNVEASRLFKLACDNGELRGCVNLARIEYKNGNKTEAMRLYKIACDGGEVLSCSNLGYLESQNRNYGEAKRLYQKGCDGGDKNACNSAKDFKKFLWERNMFRLKQMLVPFLVVLALFVFIHYFLGAIVSKNKFRDDRIEPESKTGNVDEEWKEKEEALDLTQWKEVMIIPQRYNPYGNAFGPNTNTLDLGELQTLLAQNEIASKIYPSTSSISPSDGLFVKVSDFEKTKRLLEILDKGSS